MRVVYLSNFRPPPDVRPSEEYVAAALRDLGHEVIPFQVPPWRHRKRIPLLKPDMILVHHSRDMPRRWIRALPRENPGALVVQWLFDYLRFYGERKWFLPRAKAWDLSFLKDRGRFAYYREEGIQCHWLHQGAPAGFSFSEGVDARHECDVAFLGTPHSPYRIEVLKRIAAEGLRVHIYTNKRYIDRWRGYGFEHVFPSLHDEAMGPICANAKFVLAVGVYPDEWEGYWSSRPYLTLASGGLCLTQYVPGMEEHFEHEKHLLWWHDAEECLELIRRYDDLEAERNRIRRAGWEHVHAHHTYHDRCRELMAICERERLRRAHSSD